MKSHHKAVAIIAVFLFISGCSSSNGPGTEDEPVIQVDSRVLTLAEFNEFFEPLRMGLTREQKEARPALEEARHRFLLELVEEMIILRRAEELDLRISPQELEEAVGTIEGDYDKTGFKEMFVKQAISVQTWRERLRRRLLVEKVVRKELLEKISVEPEEIREYYNKYHDKWALAEQIRPYHILVSSEEEAKRLLERVREGEDFAALARQSSMAPESERGGDMGYVARGQLPKSIEDPLFALEKDTVSPIIKTPYGYHIFKVVEKRAANDPIIDQWTQEIKGHIREEKLEAAYGPWLAQLRSRYRIVVNRDII